jgi:predicted O-linked N-acetylglucosamine transferase (SPINDLY family)
LQNTLPRDRSYLTIYEDIDILLDVFPWNGHATTCESILMGVPVITLVGDRHAGRLSAGVLACIGMAEWLATDREGYVAQAVRWSSSLEELNGLRSLLRPRLLASPLCDAKSFTRSLEDAYRWMWRRWCQSVGAVP